MLIKPTEFILGYPITRKSKEACTSDIVRWIENDRKGKYLACANPHSLEVARIDPLFQKALKGADLIVPDGVGIIVASKILGGRISNRITGSDIFFELSKILNKKGNYSYFFLGSTQDTLKKIEEKLRIDFKNINVVGTYSPPFKAEFSTEDNIVMIEKINRVKPDVLWVGMTAPKQEKWIYTNKDKLKVKFIGAVGAVFDFYSGNVERSHQWFLVHGLEWLPRLLKQPLRLWRRNIVSNPMFLIRILWKRYISRDSNLKPSQSE
jgi:N-acetylglucosaminyldiphosphoundecaprenol N-acetyl-beta-D-mannosaminyltransferase